MSKIRIDGIQRLIGEDFMKFRILDVVDRGVDYLLSIVSKPLGNVYHLSIRKEADRAGNYPIKVWDKRKDITYPMSIDRGSLQKQQYFIYHLDTIIGGCDDMVFQGNKGNDTINVK